MAIITWWRHYNIIFIITHSDFHLIVTVEHTADACDVFYDPDDGEIELYNWDIEAHGETCEELLQLLLTGWVSQFSFLVWYVDHVQAIIEVL